MMTEQGIGPDVGQIMDYEAGTLDLAGTLELFAALISSGMAWTLQGSYGRTAQSLIDRDIINVNGEIRWDVVEELNQ